MSSLNKRELELFRSLGNTATELKSLFYNIHLEFTKMGMALSEISDGADAKNAGKIKSENPKTKDTSTFDKWDFDDLDTKNRPWDERIHAGSKGKKADGTWKMKSGVGKQPEMVSEVESELDNMVKKQLDIDDIPGVDDGNDDIPDIDDGNDDIPDIDDDDDDIPDIDDDDDDDDIPDIDEGVDTVKLAGKASRILKQAKGLIDEKHISIHFSKLTDGADLSDATSEQMGNVIEQFESWIKVANSTQNTIGKIKSCYNDPSSIQKHIDKFVPGTVSDLPYHDVFNAAKSLDKLLAGVLKKTGK